MAEEKPKEEKVKKEKTNSKTKSTRKSKTTKKKRKSKKPSKVVLARGKRKRAIARARIREGNGKITLNSKSLKLISNEFIRDMIEEPIRYSGVDVSKLDIAVNVRGGGEVGQAQAARTAIAKALVEYFPELNLRDKFMEIDRSLVVEDIRRVEPKKYKGPKARARYQKSYR